MCVESSPGALMTLLQGELRMTEKLGPVQSPIRDGTNAQMCSGGPLIT